MNLLLKIISKKFRYIKYRYLQRILPKLWPNHIQNYPFKCRRYLELTEQFLAERRIRFGDNQMSRKLCIDSYRELIGDKESENAVQEILDYYNCKLLKSRFCPSDVTIEDMSYMLKNLDSFYRKIRHLEFLFVREFDCWRHRIKEEELKAIKREKESKELLAFGGIGCFDGHNELQYGYWRNTLFPRYYDRSCRRYSFNNLRNATLFGQKLVIDCSYDKEMQEYETQSAGRQMAKIYHTNRMESRDPFDLHFCSCDPNSRVVKHFIRKFGPDMNSRLESKLYLNIHSQTYSQLFPNQRFIYLSPDARQLMSEFDPNAIYILGSLVGKTCRLPLSRDKAEREGLECYKLPIHLYVSLNARVKRTLSFQSCFKILLELKEHRDWKLAFINGIQEHKLKDNGLE